MFKCCDYLLRAYDNRHSNCFKLLINTTELEKRNSSGYTILNYMCWYSCEIEYITTLLKHKADVNTSNNDDNTPLIYAICRYNYEHVKLLLENNADFSIVNNKGKTALNIAKETSNQEIIELLEHYIYSNTYNTMMEIFDESSTGMLDDLANLSMEYL